MPNFKPLNKADLTKQEQEILRWLQSQPWKEVSLQRGLLLIPTTENGGIGRVTANGGHRDFEFEGLIRKLERLGVIGQQEPYPVKGIPSPHDWSICMTLEELANIGITPTKEVGAVR